MVLIHFLFALSISLLLVALFAGSYRRDERWQDIFLIFFLIFLASWAGGLWLAPIGPLVWGVSLVPFLVTGVLFALLLAMGGGVSRRSTSEGMRAAEQATEVVAVSILTWTLVALLLLSIVIHYLWFAALPAY